jgi:hypothetical protein
MFRATDPAKIPDDVPEGVRDAVTFSWGFDRDTAAQYDWGDRPLHVLRFRREWMCQTSVVDAMLVPDTGHVEYTVDILRRLIAQEGGFGDSPGVHEGVAVVTIGLVLRQGLDQLPDLPDGELREWAREARDADKVTEYRGTVGVFDGWRFHVEAIRGRGAAQIAVYEPGEIWQERHRLIDDVVMLDKHLRASPM